MKNRGFTLLEVLISMAVLAMIMGSVWGATKQSLDAKERVEKRDSIYQGARVALRKISDDISMAFLIKSPAERTAAAAVAGAATAEVQTRPRPITFFIGEDRGDRDEVRFTTLSNIRLFKNAKQSDQAKVSYSAKPSPDDSQIINLVRTFSPHLNEENTVEGTSYVIAENIQEFSVEYYDLRKQDWGRTWNSETIDWKDRLPRAVRITISFPDPENDRESIVLRTATMIALSAGPIEF